MDIIQFIWRPSDEDFANLQKAINPPESKESKESKGTKGTKGTKRRKGGDFEMFKYIYEQNVLGLNEARIPKVSDKPTPVKSKYR